MASDPFFWTELGFEGQIAAVGSLAFLAAHKFVQQAYDVVVINRYDPSLKKKN